ncbi:hypothetical protein HDV01_002672, partial [Terramyces sp. JEL0728]
MGCAVSKANPVQTTATRDNAKLAAVNKPNQAPIKKSNTDDGHSLAPMIIVREATKFQNPPPKESKYPEQKPNEAEKKPTGPTKIDPRTNKVIAVEQEKPKESENVAQQPKVEEKAKETHHEVKPHEPTAHEAVAHADNHTPLGKSQTEVVKSAHAESSSHVNKSAPSLNKSAEGSEEAKKSTPALNKSLPKLSEEAPAETKKSTPALNKSQPNLASQQGLNKSLSALANQTGSQSALNKSVVPNVSQAAHNKSHAQLEEAELKKSGSGTGLNKVGSNPNLNKTGSNSNLNKTGSNSNLNKTGSNPNLNKNGSSSNLNKVGSSSNLAKPVSNAALNNYSEKLAVEPTFAPLNDSDKEKPVNQSQSALAGAKSQSLTGSQFNMINSIINEGLKSVQNEVAPVTAKSKSPSQAALNKSLPTLEQPAAIPIKASEPELNKSQPGLNKSHPNLSDHAAAKKSEPALNKSQPALNKSQPALAEQA